MQCTYFTQFIAKCFLICVAFYLYTIFHLEKRHVAKLHSHQRSYFVCLVSFPSFYLDFSAIFFSCRVRKKTTTSSTVLDDSLNKNPIHVFTRKKFKFCNRTSFKCNQFVVLEAKSISSKIHKQTNKKKQFITIATVASVYFQNH